jgi:hypothetical protein
MIQTRDRQSEIIRKKRNANVSNSPLIPKAAYFWILGEGHSASLRSVGSTSRRHRLCALACSLVTMGRVRASRPVSTRPRRPCPFFCAAKSNFKVPMVLILFSVSPVFSRASAGVGAPLYPRVDAGRLMFGTPAARRPYLLNDLV